MYCKHLITCVNCKVSKEQSKHSARGTYCSNRCQMDFQYKVFIAEWLAGKISGLSGRKGISNHVRHYVFDKFNSKCCECGWCEKHPTDGRVPLEVNHIDGDYTNTTDSNLNLLCPNCHSLTPSYKARNKGKSSRNYKPVVQ